jgi:tetratricopeptide (TPR) repeat protein
LAYGKLGQWDKALDDLAKAVQLSPERYLPVRARVYARLRQWDKALADAGEAIRLQPQAAALRAARGALYAEQRKWAEAMTDFQHAAKLDKDKPIHHYRAAMVALGRHDRKGYRRICAGLVERSGKTADAVAGRWVAWACSLAPDAADDLGRAVQLADTAVRARPKSHLHLNTHGAIMYRTGEFKKAVERLHQAHEAWEAASPKPPPSSPAYTWFFLAMAHHRLGHAEQAREWLDQAAKWAEKTGKDSVRSGPGRKPLPWNRRLTLELLRREAESLIGPADRPKPGRKEVTPPKKD